MEASGSPTGGDNQDNVREARRGRGRPRHRFTKDELQVLNQSFEQDPYPDFTARKELASQIHCHLYVVENWFQNRRAKLPPKEKRRIFTTRRCPKFPVQGSSLPDYKNTGVQSFYGQDAFLGRAGYSSLDAKGVPSGWVGLRDFGTSGSNMQFSCASEYIDSPRSEHSSSPSPADFVYFTTSEQYFQSAGYESWGDPSFSSVSSVGREWAASRSFGGPLQDSSQVSGNIICGSSYSHRITERITSATPGQVSSYLQSQEFRGADTLLCTIEEKYWQCPVPPMAAGTYANGGQVSSSAFWARDAAVSCRAPEL